MKLIDADAFLERMKGTDRYFSIKFDIESQPTAYDVDGVVERLESLETYTQSITMDKHP